jgi:hypothetical protein
MGLFNINGVIDFCYIINKRPYPHQMSSKGLNPVGDDIGRVAGGVWKASSFQNNKGYGIPQGSCSQYWHLETPGLRSSRETGKKSLLIRSTTWTEGK